MDVTPFKTVLGCQSFAIVDRTGCLTGLSIVCLQCSVSCGGGVQHRLVKCVNTKAELEDENEHVDCDHEPRPKNTKKCNIHDCDSAPSGKWSFAS